MTIPFINIHHHKDDQNSLETIKSINVKNFIWGKNSLSEINNSLDDSYFTVGFHPWFLENINFDKFKTAITQIKNHKNFFALGEMGLDRYILKRMNDQERQSHWNKQLTIFNQQLELAKELNITNIILHCVRSFSDILPKTQEYKNINFIFHDFQGNSQEIQKINQSPNLYYSLGSVLRNQKKADRFDFGSIDLEKLFLETDDSDWLIQSVYEKFLVQITQKTHYNQHLKQKVLDNFNRLLN